MTRRLNICKSNATIHADVEALALSSFGVPTEKEVEVYGDIIAAGDTLLAAYTVAVDVAEEAPRKSDKAEREVEKLIKALKRSESLAILHDHIKDFRIDIAYKMRFCSWAAVADKLHYERKNTSRPTHVLLETTLKNNHLSMKVRIEVREVADVGNKKGREMDAKLVMQLTDKLLPDDLVHTKASLKQMPQYVNE